MENNVFIILKQGRKRPKICIESNKRGTFGERKRDREREKEKEIQTIWKHQWTIQ